MIFSACRFLEASRGVEKSDNGHERPRKKGPKCILATISARIAPFLALCNLVEKRLWR